ncbi:hypothetical protein O3P69_015196 [Scylla paramamosain]|uniref:Uncharacterized protein n=1 Tax=Scylla paramamosain TaxID=85552 RepID=A0AAW0T427_SCYPA
MFLPIEDQAASHLVQLLEPRNNIFRTRKLKTQGANTLIQETKVDESNYQTPATRNTMSNKAVRAEWGRPRAETGSPPPGNRRQRVSCVTLSAPPPSAPRPSPPPVLTFDRLRCSVTQVTPVSGFASVALPDAVMHLPVISSLPVTPDTPAPDTLASSDGRVWSRRTKKDIPPSRALLSK